MGNLIVVSFQTEAGASQALAKVDEMHRLNLMQVDDAATAVRHLDGTIHVRQAIELKGMSALSGAFWGMLFGLLFFVPFLGAAVGAATGALFGKSADLGINDEFIKRVSNAVQPGSSALFLLVSHAKIDRVLEQLEPIGGQIIHTTLSKDEEARLKEAFGNT